MKFNAISRDFPMNTNFSNLSPSQPKVYKPKLKLFQDIKNGYNNESPDFFRLDSMKDNKTTYRNPYLGDVISEDRNSFYKEMNKTKENIDLIDKLKSKRELSQNPNLLKLVDSKNDVVLKNHRNRKKMNNYNSFSPMIREYLLSPRMEDFRATQEVTPLSPKPELYKVKLTKMVNEYSPKMTHYVKKKLNINVNNQKPELVAPILSSINSNKSAYLKNYNDYDISENFKDKEEKFLYYDKLASTRYDCILDKNLNIKPHTFRNRKWESFYEK
jgi:hypothetical protein